MALPWGGAKHTLDHTAYLQQVQTDREGLTSLSRTQGHGGVSSMQCANKDLDTQTPVK